MASKKVAEARWCVWYSGPFKCIVSQIYNSLAFGVNGNQERIISVSIRNFTRRIITNFQLLLNLIITRTADSDYSACGIDRFRSSGTNRNWIPIFIQWRWCRAATKYKGLAAFKWAVRWSAQTLLATAPRLVPFTSGASPRRHKKLSLGVTKSWRLAASRRGLWTGRFVGTWAGRTSCRLSPSYTTWRQRDGGFTITV